MLCARVASVKRAARRKRRLNRSRRRTPRAVLALAAAIAHKGNRQNVVRRRRARRGRAKKPVPEQHAVPGVQSHQKAELTYRKRGTTNDMQKTILMRLIAI